MRRLSGKDLFSIEDSHTPSYPRVAGGQWPPGRRAAAGSKVLKSGAQHGLSPGLRPLRILGAVSAGFGLAAEALYNSAERRKKSLSHTSQNRGNRKKSSAHRRCACVGSDFHETELLKFRKHFGTCARNATFENPRRGERRIRTSRRGAQRAPNGVKFTLTHFSDSWKSGGVPPRAVYLQSIY